ncbi:MAG TPA: Do family serine endopeptidase [Pseudomonadota bacterium]|nr:Do family serine endopeptidase [Pseudomonadota bacterium]
MTNVPTVYKPRRVLSARRIVLLATVSALVAGGALAGSGVQLQLPHFSSAQAAESAQRMPGFADLVEKVKPAVISVRVKVEGAKMMNFEGETPLAPNSPMERFFRRFGMPFGDETPNKERAPHHRPMTGQGSGFFITADGYAVTNNHVVDKAQAVEITTDDGKTYSAKVIGTDARTDLALIKVNGRNDFPFVKLADKAPRIGDWVVAVGNPFGLGGTVTAGIVSARGRDIGAGPYDDFVQIDAPVNKGNSGGPTFDMDGNVIGVNTAIFSPSGGSVGIAFDIPSETVKSVVAQLKDKGVVSRGWIGVQIQPVTPEIAEGLGMKANEGALVAEPQADSPAAKAGIESGDVITAVNGHAVKDARDLARQIGAMAPGSTAKLGVWRKGEDKSFSLTLGELPKERQAALAGSDSPSRDADIPTLGLMLAPAAQVAGSGSEGVVVTEVNPDGLASEHGFKTGDVILDVGGKKVASATDVRNALVEAKKDGKRSVLMRLKSEEATRFVAIPIARA